ncbi:MAG: hypothetical protein K0U86_05075 [Planctomycetes bacterium]|nr:hypothetical protein [Planctomycetota bacterium]MCH9724262.1 hypothetical protein [Planctomycetota bacterium]MCH9778973.1 hypothetical protein [Planctomycetota bacterium]
MNESRHAHSTCFTVLLLAGVVFPLSARGEQNTTAEIDEVQKLIREVALNEKFYSNLKLNLISTKTDEVTFFQIDAPKPIENETQISLDMKELKFRREDRSKGRYVVITQSGLGWPKEKTPPANANYTVIGTQERTTVSDGQTCRHFWTEDVTAEKKGGQRQTSSNGLISDKLQRLPNFARPHMFLMENRGPKVPLSTYLKGVKAIRAFPGPSNLGKGRVCNVRILGIEEFLGLQCLKILIEILDPKGTPRTRRELWLARDRNLIPVRTLSYTYKDSKDIAIAEGIVDELQEVRPGVWFPLKAHYNRFSSMTVKREGRQELSWQVKYDVKSVLLDPKIPPEMFTTLNFPLGTKVSLVKDGKLTKLKDGDKSP